MMRTTTVCLVAILANAYLCGASSVLPMMRLRGGAQVWDSVQHFVSDVHAAERGGEERVVELLEKWQNVDARFKALVEQKNQEAKESMSESKDSEEDIEGIVDSKDPRLDMVTGGTLDLDDRGPLVVVEADAALAFIEGWSELSADAQESLVTTICEANHKALRVLRSMGCSKLGQSSRTVPLPTLTA